MKDVDRSKFYDSQKRTAPEKPAEPSEEQKELLVLQSRLEEATGEDRERLQKQVEGIANKLKSEGKLPPTT